MLGCCWSRGKRSSSWTSEHAQKQQQLQIHRSRLRHEERAHTRQVPRRGHGPMIVPMTVSKNEYRRPAQELELTNWAYSATDDVSAVATACLRRPSGHSVVQKQPNITTTSTTALPTPTQRQPPPQQPPQQQERAHEQPQGVSEWIRDVDLDVDLDMFVMASDTGVEPMDGQPTKRGTTKADLRQSKNQNLLSRASQISLKRQSTGGMMFVNPLRLNQLPLAQPHTQKLAPGCSPVQTPLAPAAVAGATLAQPCPRALNPRYTPASSSSSAAISATHTSPGMEAPAVLPGTLEGPQCMASDSSQRSALPAPPLESPGLVVDTIGKRNSAARRASVSSLTDV